MDFGIGILIATFTIITIFIVLMWKEANKENSLRKNDTKLQKFYYEMNLEANDGWTKKHYKELYEQRIKELKDK